MHDTSWAVSFCGSLLFTHNILWSLVFLVPFKFSVHPSFPKQIKKWCWGILSGSVKASKREITLVISWIHGHEASILLGHYIVLQGNWFPTFWSHCLIKTWEPITIDAALYARRKQSSITHCKNPQKLYIQILISPWSYSLSSQECTDWKYGGMLVFFINNPNA